MQLFHPTDKGFQIQFPDDWLLIPQGMGGELLAYEQQERGDDFRANVFLSRRRGVSENLQDISPDSLHDLSTGLNDWRLLDLEHLGAEKFRLLGRYVQGIHHLTLEQWSTIADGDLFTFSATCLSTDYADLAEEFREIEASLSVAT